MTRLQSFSAGFAVGARLVAHSCAIFLYSVLVVFVLRILDVL